MAQPLDVIIKFPNQNNKKKEDEFSEWEEDEGNDNKSNIGLQEIKLIEF